MDTADRSQGGGMELPRHRIVLWAVILLAFFIRAWGLSHQLPYKSYIEEDEFIYTALKYGSGDLNPHWFFHPPLLSYLLFLLYGFYYAAGRACGLFPSSESFILQYLVDPSAFYIIARSVSAALIVPSLLALYSLGRSLYSPRIALAACAFFAVMPLGVLYSHYGCTEPLVVLFALLTGVSAARLLLTGRQRWALLSGVLAGVTAGTKYIGVFAALLPLGAAFELRGRRSLISAALAVAGAGAGFLTVCPFPLIAPREFISNLRLLLLQPVSVGEWGGGMYSNLHRAFAAEFMPAGMGTTLAVASIAGALFLWIRHRRDDLLIAVVPTSFYLLVGFSRLYYDRYMLVCYPFFALAAAVLCDAAARRLWGARSSAILALACAAVALPSLRLSVNRVRALLLPDGAIAAAQWVTENLPAGTRLLVDLAPVPLSEASIVREQRMKLASPRAQFGYRQKTGAFFDLQRRAARGGKGFEVMKILHPRGFHMRGGGKGYEEEWMTPELMSELVGDLAPYDYIVASVQRALRYADRAKLPPRFRFMHDFYFSLPSKAVPVKVFSASSGKCKGMTYIVYRVKKLPQRIQKPPDQVLQVPQSPYLPQ